MVRLTKIKFSLNVITKRGTILLAGGVLQDGVLQHSDAKHFALALSLLTAPQDSGTVMQSWSVAHPYIPYSLPSLLVINFAHLSWPVIQVTLLAFLLLHFSMLPTHLKQLKAWPVGKCSMLVSRCYQYNMFWFHLLPQKSLSRRCQEWC